MRRGTVGGALGLMVLMLAGSTLGGLLQSASDALPAEVPRVLAGFSVTPLTALPVPTAIAFGPGTNGGPDLYATTLAGTVYRVALQWTEAGPVVTGIRSYASGFSQPLGLVWVDGDLYVSDSVTGAESGRLDGRVSRVTSSGTHVVVGGLPNGRHNTNHLRLGPDGRLYIANGNPNDNGRDGGDADVFPYSGAILSVDPAQVNASPAVLHWRNGQGQISAANIATDPSNADFASKVHVLAHGFRNVFGVAFSPEGIAYTGMNGADDPASQDALFRIVPGTDYGFPFCYDEGLPGATAGGSGIAVAANPTFPGHDCTNVPAADALLGWHACATGLDVAPAGSAFGRAVYVGECGPLFQDDVERIADDPARASYDVGHKVARVTLDATGHAVEVQDFIVGLGLPTDALFGPDGALYVADAGGVLRVAALPAA